MSNISDLMGLGMSPELAKIVANMATGFLTNDEYLKARNAAGTNDLNLLKADSTDHTVLNAATGKTVKIAINGSSVLAASATAITPAVDLSPAAGITFPAGQTLKLAVSTIAAAGADNTDATAVAQQVSYVTASDDAKGVKLPAGSVGEVYVIHNTVAGKNLLVYPPASGTINGGTATTGSVTVAGEETAVLVKVAANTWFGGVCADF